MYYNVKIVSSYLNAEYAVFHMTVFQSAGRKSVLLLVHFTENS